MKTRLLTFAVVLTALALPLRAADQPSAAPHVFSLPAQNLAAAKARLAQGDPALAPALAALRADADRALQFKPVSVMDKTRTPPSGDKHDYISQAPYWWPDPKNPSGPYIRHDGERNPEIERGTDRVAWGRLTSAIDTLGLAYYFTGHQPYAEHAARLVRVWFLDPATRMNPNVNFGQYVPGINDGRAEGVLETHTLTDVCDALALIGDSPAWTAEDARGFRAWLAEYFTWLTTSRIGLAEAAAKNNHGSWYDFQAAHLALVLGKTDYVKKLLTDGLQKRLAFQIEPDGRQPLELARTKSFGYSLMNLEALFHLARLGEQVGADWWSFTTKDGRSLSAALGFLAPYVDREKPWIKKDLVAPERTRLVALLTLMLRHRDNAEFRRLLDRFSRTSPSDARWRLVENAP